MRLFLLALLLCSACRCDDSPPPVRKAETRRPPQDEAALAKIPGPEGATFDPSALAALLPAALGDAASEAEAQTETTALANEGQLPIARRIYVRDNTRITVQLTDMQHAPLMRQMMRDAKQQAEKSAKPSWTPATVQGYDAVLQYMPSHSAAIANIAVTERLFVNVRVEPADRAELALTWADKLPLEPITKLEPPETSPAAPSR